MGRFVNSPGTMLGISRTPRSCRGHRPTVQPPKVHAASPPHRHQRAGGVQAQRMPWQPSVPPPRTAFLTPPAALLVHPAATHQTGAKALTLTRGGHVSSLTVCDTCPNPGAQHTKVLLPASLNYPGRGVCFSFVVFIPGICSTSRHQWFCFMRQLCVVREASVKQRTLPCVCLISTT